jgi:hypothetical protein
VRRAQEVCKGVCDDRESSCCVTYLKLFYDLYGEYRRRRDELLDELFFHRFAKKHPGLEHNAGVVKGGTLVLVCTTDAQRDEQTEKFLMLIRRSKEIEEGVKEEFIRDFTGMTVVADFCLPYICCSKGLSVKAEFYQTAPVADFIETKREAIVEGDEATGQTVTIENRSKNAEIYYLTIFNTDGDITGERTEVKGKEISFDLLLKNGTDFLVQLDAQRGSLTSTKQASFDISPDDTPVTGGSTFASRAKGYKNSLQEIGTDKAFASMKKYVQTEAFLNLKKKNIDKEFANVVELLQSRFDTSADHRKQQVIQSALLATLFYVDRQVENAGDDVPAAENELIRPAVEFIKANKVKADKIIEAWDPGAITTDANKAVVDTYKSMLE